MTNKIDWDSLWRDPDFLIEQIIKPKDHEIEALKTENERLRTALAYYRDGIKSFIDPDHNEWVHVSPDNGATARAALTEMPEIEEPQAPQERSLELWREYQAQCTKPNGYPDYQSFTAARILALETLCEQLFALLERSQRTQPEPNRARIQRIVDLMKGSDNG